jgi:hypothetical protein
MKELNQQGCPTCSCTDEARGIWCRHNDGWKQFQVTFSSENGLVGEFPYYCTIHPWITAMISSNDTVVQGESFEFRSGTGPTLDLSENNRTLLAFPPIDFSINQLEVMFYDFSVIRDSDNQTMFTNQFEVQNNDLEVELIQFPEISKFGVTFDGQNAAVWNGRAFHVARFASMFIYIY